MSEFIAHTENNESRAANRVMARTKCSGARKSSGLGRVPRKSLATRGATRQIDSPSVLAEKARQQERAEKKRKQDEKKRQEKWEEMRMSNAEKNREVRLTEKDRKLATTEKRFFVDETVFVRAGSSSLESLFSDLALSRLQQCRRGRLIVRVHAMGAIGIAIGLAPPGSLFQQQQRDSSNYNSLAHRTSSCSHNAHLLFLRL